MVRRSHVIYSWLFHVQNNILGLCRDHFGNVSMLPEVQTNQLLNTNQHSTNVLLRTLALRNFSTITIHIVYGSDHIHLSCHRVSRLFIVKSINIPQSTFFARTHMRARRRRRRRLQLFWKAHQLSALPTGLLTLCWCWWFLFLRCAHSRTRNTFAGIISSSIPCVYVIERISQQIITIFARCSCDNTHTHTRCDAMRAQEPQSLSCVERARAHTEPRINLSARTKRTRDECNRARHRRRSTDSLG